MESHARFLHAHFLHARALMPPPVQLFSQSSTPFENQLFCQKYAEEMTKCAPLLVKETFMTVLSSIQPAIQIKTKNKVGRPNEVSLEESDIEFDEESTRKRSRSNSVSNQSRYNQKGHETYEVAVQMNSVEIECLKKKLIKVEQNYSKETDRLKNRLLVVELANTSKTQDIENL